MKTIKATDKTIHKIVKIQIKNFGRNVDLNHVDTSDVTNMDYLFFRQGFNGDVSRWDVRKVVSLNCTFYGSPFNGDLSRWNLCSLKRANYTFKYCMLRIPPNIKESLKRAKIVGWNKH